VSDSNIVLIHKLVIRGKAMVGLFSLNISLAIRH
jgi:hypothetical protein